MHRPHFLVTGASGQVGGELVRSLASLGTVTAPSSAEVNLADPASLRVFIRSTKPGWIVNAAAYTAVDLAEKEPEKAFAINAEAVRVLGEEARSLGIPVIHFSTDYVFDGGSPRPYVEADPIGPLSVYGASKLAGEQALYDTGAASFIFRTSWVYGATGKNFLRTILKAAREHEELRIVCDQHGAPTWSRDLARMAAHVVAFCERDGARESLYQFAGIYHAAGGGETTWAGFTEEALRQTQFRDPLLKLAKIRPIHTSEYPTAVARPLNSRLNCEKLFKVFGWRMMDWRQSLAEVLAELS